MRFQGATTIQATRVVSGSTCGTGSDKGQLSHENADGTSNVYSDFYMRMHHHSQCNLTNHMRSQHMPAHILQVFWGFPALRFVILETLFLNHFLAGLPWSSLASGPSGGLRFSPEHRRGLIHAKMSLSMLSCWHFLVAGVAYFLGNTHTSLLDEKDSLDDRNGNLSLLWIGKAAFGTWGFVLILFLKKYGLPSTSPSLFSHCLKNRALWNDT